MRQKEKKRLHAAMLVAALSLATVLSGCTGRDQTIERETAELAPGQQEGATGTMATAADGSGQAALLQAQDVADDFWQPSTPAAEGMNETLLLQLESVVKAEHQRMYSLLVIRHGHVVVEQYYHNRSAEDTAGVYSVSKSILSALTGIAIHDGLFTNVYEPVAGLLPEAAGEALKQPLALKHLLTLTGGLGAVDADFSAFSRSPNWVQHVVEQPITDKPGAVFGYNTGLTHLLSAAITNVSGMSTAAYAEQHLLAPLGITQYAWDQDPQGISVGGTGVSMRPRDMARFGYLYLKQGQWQGQQLVPKDWVEESIKDQVKPDRAGGYGYLFWLGTVKTADGAKHSSFAAEGYGDQLILVVPDLDLVVVVTSDPDSSEEWKARELIDRYIIPAIEVDTVKEATP
ncbi:serine hydrolase domain-containing protein [Paenibacillus sp. MMS18-CY102]|uniref:serine hydrolase domain-containing protein n=1 Tax=Paenibacillus sp. MMS18-CY102 TaxID=2682849 RepID=UPI0013658FC3|nr:serine hydrolase [Paenibacillus sp. MMS18-CY102]MWC29441.1 serine hydrolase [Paenibacillus sp. MMS18-CY102]